VPGEQVVRGGLLQRRVDPAAEVVVGVEAAEEDAVVQGAPVVVELVARVGEAFAALPPDGARWAAVSGSVMRTWS
jgi:hypothetical protein